MSGEIPAGLFALPSLSNIDLSHNNLSGIIPKGFGELLQLRATMTLAICFNNISGRIPYKLVKERFVHSCFDEANLCSDEKEKGLTACSTDWCSDDRIRGYMDCSSKSKKKSNYIIITCSAIAGILIGLGILILVLRPRVGRRKEHDGEEWSMISFQSLENLENLVLKNTKSQWLSHFCLKIPMLCFFEALNLSSNSMDPPGREVSAGGATIRLRNLDLSYNNISGHNIFVMLSPSDFPDLELLSLKGNKLSGKFWELSFRNLSYLDLSANNFFGKVPSFQGCSSLQHLDLSSNCFSGNIGASLSSCYNLSFLNLSNNMFGGGVAKLPSGSLQYLYLRGNHFGGELPGHIGDLCTTLVELDLSSNNFLGTVPETLGDCSALELLDLSNNTFSGELPVETLLNLTSLKTLFFSFNNFVGGFSESLSSLLEGEIPLELRHLQSLESLILDFNQLSGSIPESLSNCTNLKWISLSNNLLSGAIPTSLGGLSYLTTVKARKETPSLGTYLLSWGIAAACYGWISTPIS
nr:systemin receptor SR160 [Ipomoea batatas]